METIVKANDSIFKMSELKLIIKQIILNFKFVFKNKFNIILCMSILLFCLSIPVILIPLSLSSGLVYTLACYTICSIVFSSIHFKVRKSTLYDNITLTRNNKWTFTFSSLITILVINLLITLIVFFSILVLSNFDLMIVGLWKYSSHESIVGNKYYNINFDLLLLIIYGTTLIAISTFAISFALVYFLKDQKSFFSSVVIIIIWIVIFGGTFNDYFNVPNPSNVNSLWTAYNPLFPWTLFIVGLLNPFFGSSNLISNAYTLNIVEYNQTLSWVPNYWYLYGNGSVFKLMFFNKGNPIEWRVQLWFVWIEIFICLIVGAIGAKFNRN